MKDHKSPFKIIARKTTLLTIILDNQQHSVFLKILILLKNWDKLNKKKIVFSTPHWTGDVPFM